MATINEIPIEILRLIFVHLHASYISTIPIPVLPDPYDRSSFWNAVGDRMSWIKSRDSETLHRRNEFPNFMKVSNLWNRVLLELDLTEGDDK